MQTKIQVKTKDGKTTEIYTWETSEEEYHEHANDNGGACIACGDLAYGVEPDARGYECESCGKNKVYGIEELMLAGRIVIV